MPTQTPRRTSAVHDFDFLAGTWTTRQRRLKARLQGCTDWETFTATARMQQLPGGIANVDTLVAEAWRPGWVGMSFRFYNPLTDLWSICWVTNDGGGIDRASGRLDAPVVGRFDGDEGLFEGDDVLDGRPIRVRYRWQRLGDCAARWEQAFSVDGGQCWEVNWTMDFERATDGDAGGGPAACVAALDLDCQVLELRRYTLHPGQRDTLIELFDREFVETQEAVGMAVLGQYRDLDAPDRFVWLRGFANMATRARGLASFYGGPVWARHRQAANATMIDFSNVLLLKPAWPGAGVATRGRLRPSGPVRMALPGLVDLRVFDLREAASPALLQFCREVMTPCLQRAGASVQGWFVTEGAVNSDARPVREGLHVLVGLARFDDAAVFDDFVCSGVWQRDVQPGLAQWLAGPGERHRLVATARSATQAPPHMVGPA